MEHLEELLRHSASPAKIKRSFQTFPIDLHVHIDYNLYKIAIM